MDESFLPFNKTLEELSAIEEGFTDQRSGIYMYISGMEIETPVELDIVIDAQGKIKIGSIPPLYNVDTTFKPSYHKIKFTLINNTTENGI